MENPARLIGYSDFETATTVAAVDSNLKSVGSHRAENKAGDDDDDGFHPKFTVKRVVILDRAAGVSGLSCFCTQK